MDTSGFYKQTEEGWFYAPNFVYSKDYELNRDNNRQSIDGWNWFDEEPIEYTEWVKNQNPLS